MLPRFPGRLLGLLSGDFDPGPADRGRLERDRLEQDRLERDRLRRIRSIQLGTLAMSVVAAPFVAHFWFLGMGYLSWALVATVVVAWLNVLWLRGHRDSRWGGHLAAAALFLLLVISNSTSGGFYDPNLGWLYTVPMVATFFDDLRAGWIWVGIVLVALIAFWLLPIFGIVVPDLVPPERHAVQSLLNRCLILVSLAVLASAFVKAYQRTEDALEEEVKERRRAESEIRDLLDDVLRAEAQMVQSEKMASLGQLVAGVAHEVNNPINFISCALPILRRDLASLGALADEAHAERREQLRKRIEEVLSTIDEGVRRTSEVVRNLRTFSRLGEAEIKLADLHEAIDVTLSLLRFELAERQVEVERCYGGIPLVECYISELNQVFMNLLINAVQAVPNDGSGKIGITTERADVGGDRRVRISVIDNGCGIPQESLAKIYDPFFTTKPVGEGTGLGLAISHGIVTKHGGRILLQSVVGEGTTFTVELPLRLTPRG